MLERILDMNDEHKPDSELNQELQSKEKKRNKNFYIRLAIVYAICIFLLFLTINYYSFAGTVTKLTKVLMPLFYGLLIAYFCNPIFKLFSEKVFKKIKSSAIKKTLSIVLTYLIVLLLVFGFVLILIQQMAIHISSFIENLDNNIQNTKEAIIELINGFDFIKSDNEINDKQTPTTEPNDNKSGTDVTATSTKSITINTNSTNQNTIICLNPQCKTQFPENYNFCPACGLSSSINICNNCGREIKYCSICGHILSSQEDNVLSCDNCNSTVVNCPECGLPIGQNQTNNIEDIIHINDNGTNFRFTKEGIAEFVNNVFDDSVSLVRALGSFIIKWANDNNLWDSGLSVATTIYDVLLGMILSVYILIEKDMLCAKAKKITFAVIKKENAEKLVALVSYSDKKIGHFIKGKFLESVIVGFMSYILFLIAGIPSPFMIAMIVAIMNIIPVFGPFLGAVPAAFIVFIMNPSKAIPYIILVLIIMQINGNYISPKIVGSSTGLTPFAAIVALLLMSGYFGVIGMFIGIPICAILVELMWKGMDKRLNDKCMPNALDDYYSPQALCILTDERTNSKKHRNITAFVVDSTVSLFHKIFKKRSNHNDDRKNK